MSSSYDGIAAAKFRDIDSQLNFGLSTEISKDLENLVKVEVGFFCLFLMPIHTIGIIIIVLYFNESETYQSVRCKPQGCVLTNFIFHQ